MQLLLEAFDGVEDGNKPSDAPSAEYQLGYADGLAAAESESILAQDRLNADLVQTVSDRLFSFEEARLHILQNLAPLFDTLLNKLLPATLSQSLRDTLHDIVTEAATVDASQPTIIRIHPDQIVALTKALAPIEHPFLKLIPDPDCRLNAASVATPNAETAFDLDRALAQIEGIFAAVPDQTQRTL